MFFLDLFVFWYITELAVLEVKSFLTTSALQTSYCHVGDTTQ
jgi:hypothetical protein